MTDPNAPMRLSPDAVLLPGQAHAATGLDVVVSGGRIDAILPQGNSGAPSVALPGQLLMPGAVNAHQHGRGVTNLQYGFCDERLETSLHARMGHGLLDPYWATMLAARRMIASGVTGCVQGNVPYGTGDFVGESAKILSAYADAGLRALVCLGALDRAHIVYPHLDEAAFLASLPTDLAAAMQTRRKAPYAPGAAATIGAMSALLAEWGSHPRLSLGYGPAGPQWLSDEALAVLAADAHERGLMLHYHCLESWTQRAACDRLYPEGCLERMRSLGALHDRVSIAHGVWLDDGDVEVAMQADATLVRCAGSNINLAVGIAPTARYAAAGLRVAIGTDGRTIDDSEDIWREARLVGALANGDSWSDPEPLDAAALAKMLTVNGARAAGFAEVGEIREGWHADMIAVDLALLSGTYVDPDLPTLDLLAKRMTAECVRMTMVGGHILYRDGVFAEPKLARAECEAAESARRAKANSDPAGHLISKRLRPHLEAHYRNWVPPSPTRHAADARAHMPVSGL
jgi:5-methylthioadenosine/S-adenosylhomocysteine deaminase